MSACNMFLNRQIFQLPNSNILTCNDVCNTSNSNFFSMCEIQPVCIAIFQTFNMSHAKYLTIICNIALPVLCHLISYLALHCPNSPLIIHMVISKLLKFI